MTDMTAEQAFEIVDAELRRDIPAGGSQVVRAWGVIRQALTAPRVPEGWMLFPIEAWDFLSGAGVLDGYWYGDHRRGKPPFWWRPEIEKMITAGPAPADATLINEGNIGQVSDSYELAKLREQIGAIGNEVHNLSCRHQNDDELCAALSEIRDRLWQMQSAARLREGGA